MAEKKLTMSLFVGKKKIAEGKTYTLNIPVIERTSDIMQFYYRRANRYFFKNASSKLMIESPLLIDKLKRGEYYEVEMTH